MKQQMEWTAKNRDPYSKLCFCDNQNWKCRYGSVFIFEKLTWFTTLENYASNFKDIFVVYADVSINDLLLI